MISRNILFVCCLLCLLNFDQRHIIADAQNYYCANNPYNLNSTTGSIYRTNLNFVLSTLSSTASLVSNKGFYNFSAGRGPNTVYGLFLCRGDVNTDVCAQCVADAGDQIVKLCPDQKIAIIWLDECLLRYKNESMSSIVEQNIRIYAYNTQSATYPNEFNQVLGDMMDNIAIQAANDLSGKKFAVQEANYSPFRRRIYALGQCTPDLSSDNCESCLRNCIGDIPRCCNNRQGAVVLTASCNIRFELYPFYNTVTPPPPSASQPPESSPGPPFMVTPPPPPASQPPPSMVTPLPQPPESSPPPPSTITPLPQPPESSPPSTVTPLPQPPESSPPPPSTVTPLPQPPESSPPSPSTVTPRSPPPAASNPPESSPPPPPLFVLSPPPPPATNQSRINADFLYNYCVDSTYNPNSKASSIYRTNLNSVLSILSSSSRVANNGFYNFSAGSDPNTVYGLFLCRGDVTTDVCAQCVANAGDEIVKRCPDQKTAIIWFDECLLRYKNESMLSIAEQNFPIYLRTVQNVTDRDKFNQVLENLMDNITRQAANDRSGRKFAVQKANFSPFQRRIFALGQCTPDLSIADCAICLSKAVSSISGCCGRVIFASCNIRYELYPFYNPAYTPPPAPSPKLYSPGPPSSKGTRRSPETRAIPIAVPVIVASIVLFIMAFLSLKRRYDTVVLGSTDKAPEILTANALQYSLSEIQNATNNFSVDNKIGKGGYGHVYKGVLVSGQEIAVKRLSRSSGQGAEESVEEFKNEIVVVAKLQHRNLVRLLGFCLEGEEKILIFEFVPNKSLDYFLFDPEKQHYLNWSARYNIIGGIARGLLYLHEDSRLRIVHRDLKAGNILLDGNMSPKIADFGMAKICGVDQSEGNTNRIAGTIGYMAPEYARHGQFSVKSDVFSFGVVVLEIITGRKNSSFYHSNDSQDLISYVWKHWRSGTPLALLDPSVGDSYVENEVIQSIHISLLCVEEDVDRRPSMASVVYMLNSSPITLPTPRRPAFFQRNKSENQEFDQSNTPSVPGSIAEASITELYPR